MSKYTTELRFICESEAGYLESVGYNSVNDVISEARTKIFSFDYPIFDDTYKEVLETKILKHFYTREIGSETYGLFKLRLDAKMNEIMPYYNKLYNSELIEFNPIYASDITRIHMGSKQDNGEYSESVAGSYNNNKADTVNSTNLYSETPQGSLQGVDNGSYLTNATKNQYTDETYENGTNSNAKMGNTTNNTTDSYTEKVMGYDGHNPSKMISEFRNTFLNIDMMIIKELESLFMLVW